MQEADHKFPHTSGEFHLWFINIHLHILAETDCSSSIMHPQHQVSSQGGCISSANTHPKVSMSNGWEMYAYILLHIK